MYSTGESLPIESLETGTYLLAGPAMSGKYDLLVNLIVEGLSSDDAGLIVTTNQDARSIYAEIEGRGGGPQERIRLIDCVSDEHDVGDALNPDQVEFVSSPADLTGIGIGVSEQLRRFAEADIARTRVAFYSLSTLLMYSELETVFRFLHVITGRVESIEGFGVFTIDPTTHDRSTINTLKQLFDGMIELRAESDDRELRFVGIPDGPEDWVPHP